MTEDTHPGDPYSIYTDEAAREAEQNNRLGSWVNEDKRGAIRCPTTSFPLESPWPAGH